MSRRTAALLALALLGAALFFIGTWQQVPLLCLLSKPLPVIALGCWLAGRPRSAMGRWILLGLGLSLLGDILLAWPTDLFVFGLGAFLLAHLAYLRAFTRDAQQLAAAVLGLALLIGGGMFVLLWRSGLGPLLLPVAIYSLTIAAMLWRALARLSRPEIPRLSALLGAVGALLFVLSDSLIGLNRFVSPFAAAPYLILGCYWLGQWGIAASAASLPATAPVVRSERPAQPVAATRN